MGSLSIIDWLVLLLSLFIYFLPTVIANRNDHHNTTGIFLVNLLLGWTLIGWVAALVWSVSKPRPVLVVGAPAPASGNDTMPCPFCAETILAAAIKCKHCGSDLPRKP